MQPDATAKKLRSERGKGRSKKKKRRQRKALDEELADSSIQETTKKRRSKKGKKGSRHKRRVRQGDSMQ